MPIEFVWIFSGAGSRFTSGVFLEFGNAVEWIGKHRLTGVLTKYPVDVGVYDWAIANDYFEPKKETERTPEFIQRFTSAAQEHYHFELGSRD